MANTAQGRFRLLDKPMMLPGKCSCCGAGDKSVIDFGVNVPNFGRIYLCVDCSKELGRTAGLVDYSIVETLQDSLDEAMFENEELRKKAKDDEFDPGNDLNSRLIGGLVYALTDSSVIDAISAITKPVSTNADADRDDEPQSLTSNVFSLVSDSADDSIIGNERSVSVRSGK